MRRILIAALAALTFLALGATAAFAAPPATLDITLGALPNNGFELGKQTGDPVCTGEGEAQTCVTSIGTQTTLTDTVPVTDNATGSKGTLSTTCDVMFSGTTTAYYSATGTTQATGSEGCVMKMIFANGDSVFGSEIQTRVVEGTTQTSTFDIIVTGGTGTYEGFQSVLHTVEKNSWTPPPPLNEKGGKRLVLPSMRAHTVLFTRGGKGNSAKLKRSGKPVASFASIQLLLPKNKSVVVKSAAAPGQTCTGAITGASTVDLGKAVANAKGTAIFKALPAGTFADGTWKAKVTCTGGGAAKAIAQTTLKAYEVLKK